jgi:hypothetical protein
MIGTTAEQPFGVPVIVVVKDRRHWSVERTAALVPGARLETIPDCGAA